MSICLPFSGTVYRQTYSGILLVFVAGLIIFVVYKLLQLSGLTTLLLLGLTDDHLFTPSKIRYFLCILLFSLGFVHPLWETEFYS